MPPFASFPPDVALVVDDELVLALPDHGDLARITAACRDRRVQWFTRVPDPYRESDAWAFVEHAARAARQGTALELVARDDRGHLVGATGLVAIDWDAGCAEVGFWVAPWARRRRVATRTCRALCRHAFDHLGLQRVFLRTATSNQAANALASRLGFRLEGVLRSAAPAPPEATVARFDLNLWGLLPDELS